jgi:hypothetical protein
MRLEEVRTMPEIPRWVPSFGSENESEDELPLREFIYLDEVSVVSLLASLTREVTEERTDTDMTENRKRWKFRLKSTLSFIPYIGGSGSASRETVGVDRDTEEVVRRSEIQSKFDELYSETSPYFELNEVDRNEEVSVSDLTEGGVMEVDVEFSGHKLFHYYKAFQYLIDVAEGTEYAFTNQEKQVVELMGSLFGDQIPVVGELSNYKIVDEQIHEREGDTEEGEELWIAGTLDPDMLWQEPSQFLYENNNFTAYIRVPEARIQDDWDPLKLTRVIRSISQPIGDQLNGMLDAVITQSQEEFDTANLEDEEQVAPGKDHYDEYFDIIERDGDLNLSENRRRELLVSASEEVIAHLDESSYEFEIRLLKEVADLVEEQTDVDLDRDMLACQRPKLVHDLPNDGASVSDSSGRNYLEVSFVAIYW